jgi:hypothetical protein
MTRPTAPSLDADTPATQVAEFLTLLDADTPATVTIGIDLIEGADAIRGRDTDDQEQQVALVATDGDGDGDTLADYRIWLPVATGTDDDEQDTEVFDAAYRALVEALDEALTARGLDTLDADGGYRVIAKNQAWSTLRVRYTQEGLIHVLHLGSEASVGHFDADGAEWEAAVDEILASAGYRRTSNWDGDCATVEEV